jgi:glycosyltransferase involved in cell wall biosynthesis
MKHIGIVVPKFPVASETFVVTEIKSLVDIGHRVSVFCLEFDNDAHSDLPNSVEVICLANEADICTSILKFLWVPRMVNAIAACMGQKKASKLSLFRYSLRLANALNRLGCEHIHSHFLGVSLSHSVVASKLLNIPVSCVGHGHDVYQSPVDVPEKLKHCMFAVAVCADMQNHFNSISPTAVHVIHCGVNTATFRVHDQPHNQTKKLYFIGRLVEKKGLPFALKAIASLPISQRPRLDIIGDGEDKLKLVKLVNTLGITDSVRFLGYRTPEWLQSQTCHYDAMLAPFCEAKNGDRDTGPVVLKESMAMGIPVITTNFMGCKDIAEPSNGWLVKPKDSNAIADAISSLNSKTAYQLQQMRNAARLSVERQFCAFKQAKKLSQLIQTGARYVSH